MDRIGVGFFLLLANANTHAQCSDRYHKVDKNSLILEELKC